MFQENRIRNIAGRCLEIGRQNCVCELIVFVNEEKDPLRKDGRKTVAKVVNELRRRISARADKVVLFRNVVVS